MRKRLLTALFGALAFAVARAADDPAGWRLVWRDEFTGTALDRTKWSFEVNASGGGNHELQYYVTNNATVHDGRLFLEARREHYVGPQATREYTSSRVRTRLKGDWKYGRLDIRAKLPAGRGMWPAIWLMPTDDAYGGWPNSGEIDIMELIGHEPGTVYGTLHYGDPVKRHAQQGAKYTLPSGAFADDFHVFRFDWEPGQMRWYVDDRPYQTLTNWHTRAASFPAPFDQRFYLILNLAVGGDWPGAPDEKTAFPQAMAVDYVRVYRRAE